MFNHCKHQYTKWETYKEAYAKSGGIILLVQKRTCTKCGKTQLRREEC